MTFTLLFSRHTGNIIALHETALLKVRNDILMNMNQQQVTLLVMLDLIAAFDTVNHEILIKHLHSKIGLCGTPLE